MGAADPARVSKIALKCGWALSSLVTLFLLMDASMKIIKAQVAVTATMQLGYPEYMIVPLGIVLLACTVLYILPATNVLGAILLTGYLGGAVATHVRVGDPLLSHVLFPVYLGGIGWLGIFLREPLVRALVPLRRERIIRARPGH
jgi:hypothetical protein